MLQSLRRNPYPLPDTETETNIGIIAEYIHSEIDLKLTIPATDGYDSNRDPVK